jgi:hypothetical protein
MTDGADSRDQAALVRALLEARERGDAALSEQAARHLPRGQRFGAHPGKLPALLHAEYEQATDLASRCGLAAALARAWVYGGYPERGRDFAEEALRLSARVADPAAAVDALDATLLARWGPDALGDRVRLAARIEEASAYLDDTEPRLIAHLWRLTTAWECLDVVGVQRQLSALDTLAADSGSPRIAFFAASRRAMHALATADLAVADELIATARETGASSGEPDFDAVTHSLAAARARRAGDLAALRAEAAAFTAYGAAEGVPSVSAEAAVLWLEAGLPGRARELLLQLAGGGLAWIPRDVDFLLTTASLVQVAAALCGGPGDAEGGSGLVGGGPADEASALIAGIAAEGADLLAPYAGRAVINAGAVTFHGVVDEYLFRAHAALQQRARPGTDAPAAGLPSGDAPAAGAPSAEPPGGGTGSTVGGADTADTADGTATPGGADRADKADAADRAGTSAKVSRPGVAEGWRDRAASCYLRLGASWWRERLGRGAPGAGVTRPDTVAHLRREGAGWTVGFDGATFTLPDLRGLRYLSDLLARPAADVAAPDLAAAGAGHAGTVVSEAGGGAGQVADARALAAYRQRLLDLDAELEQARSWADEGRTARLTLEREALLSELRSAAGLGGRPRRFGSADERARVAVRKAIAAALARIEDRDPALARLLRDTVRTGARCRYDPDPARPVTWILKR